MPDLSTVKKALEAQRIELPSWAFGNTGTRFKVFAKPGTPRTPQEKIDDAAQVHRFTGVAPSVAVHIPWDKVDDYAGLAAYARDQGVAVGTVNANVFQDDDYMLGSVCQPGPAGAAQGPGPPAGVRRHHGRHRLAGPQAVVRGRDELPRPGLHHRRGRSGWPRRWTRSTGGCRPASG